MDERTKFFYGLVRILYLVIFGAISIQFFCASHFGVESWVTSGELLILSFVYGLSSITK